jgi:hypothetical protein
LGAETNYKVFASGVDNPHQIIIEAIQQELTEIIRRRELQSELRLQRVHRLLRERQARELQETISAVEIDVEVNAVFEQYPAPETSTINSYIRETVDDPNAAANFMGNLSLAILEAGAFCTSPLALITAAEFEYEKNVTLTNLMTGETNVVESETGTTGTNYNLTLEDIQDYEDYSDTCGNETFPNITEPEFTPNDPNRDTVDLSINIQETAYAFFCNMESQEIPAPTLTQGDVLQVCVTMEENLYLHVEETFTFVLSQPNSTAAPFVPILQKENQAPQIFFHNCELGICNHMMQVPSRFFDDPKPLQVSGVSILNLGEPDRRERLLRELQEQITDRQRDSPSYFALQVPLGVENGMKGTGFVNSFGERYWIWILIGVGSLASCCAIGTILVVRSRHADDQQEDDIDPEAKKPSTRTVSNENASTDNSSEENSR